MIHIQSTTVNIAILCPKVLRGPLVHELHLKYCISEVVHVVVHETRENEQSWTLTNLQYFMIFPFKAIQKLIGISQGLGSL